MLSSSEDVWWELNPPVMRYVMMNRFRRYQSFGLENRIYICG
jgi:hypothetical protein